MKRDVQKFINHYAPLRETFSYVEMVLINHHFIAGLMTYLESSECGTLTVDEIIQAHKLAVQYQIEHLGHTTTT